MPVKRLLGWALVVLLAVVAWNALTGNSSTACATGVHAAGDECPGYLTEAVDDPAWAADQQADIREQRVTTGRYMTSTSDAVQEITSGVDELSNTANGYLRASDTFPYPGRGRPAVVADVETKVAALMRREGVSAAVLAINHPQVCTGAMGCRQAVPAILPEGSVLYVWELDADEPVELDGEAAP